MTEQPTIKGVIIQGILENIEKQEGSQAARDLVDILAPGERPLVTTQLRSDSRVPAVILCRWYDYIKKQWGRGTGDYYSRMMQTIAEQNINIFLKFLIMLGIPSFVANSVPNIYNYYFDHGRIVMVSNTSRSIEFYLKDAEAYGEAMCSGIIGWGIQGLEMAGAKNVHVDHTQCLYKNQKRCYFKVRWD